ncbi:hypothetical protein ACFV5N_00120 [Streptomyces sp. NPDC059853]|uniref:hypothetical protein n=1 Tax=Streptomyces sp. NPDC059853 TaxID=3346973 RepID=UPI0036488BA7
MTRHRHAPDRDGLFVAARGAPAAWLYLSTVQSWLRDIQAALAEDDWPTCVEATAAALTSMLHCRLVLDGLSHPPHPGELDLHAALSDHPDAVLLRRLPVGHRASRTDAEAAAASARAAAARLEHDLPLPVPALRSPDGELLGVEALSEVRRFRADLDALRARYHLPPLPG